MASINIRYLLTIPGLLSLLTTIFLVISLALGSHAFENSMYNILYRYYTITSSDWLNEKDAPGLGRERSFIALTTIVLIFGVFHLLNRVFCDSGSEKLSVVDLVFYGLGAVFLLIAGSLLLDSSRRIHSTGCQLMKVADPDLAEKHKCQYRGEKDFGGIFALASSALYILLIVIQVLPGCAGRFSNSNSAENEVASDGAAPRGRWPWM